MFDDIIKDETEVTWEELQGYLPHPIFMKTIDPEKIDQFIEMMKEVVREKKKSLQII